MSRRFVLFWIVKVIWPSQPRQWVAKSMATVDLLLRRISTTGRGPFFVISWFFSSFPTIYDIVFVSQSLRFFLLLSCYPSFFFSLSFFLLLLSKLPSSLRYHRCRFSLSKHFVCQLLASAHSLREFSFRRGEHHRLCYAQPWNSSYCASYICQEH